MTCIESFGRERETVEDGMLKRKYIEELQEAGFQHIQAFDYDAIEYYESYEDILFLLKHTPIIPNFGQSGL